MFRAIARAHPAVAFARAATLKPITPILSRSYQISTKQFKTIKVYAPLPKKTPGSPLKTNLTGAVEKSLIYKHDPAGWRSALIDRTKPDTCLRPGDIVRVLKNDKTHFSGMVIAIKRNGLASSFLLRNKITGLGVESRYMVYSPTIRSIEIVRRPMKPKRRAKLYYVRGSTKHDVGELETEIKQKRF
ncbi:mitochondrial 54S ribosomal protein bL19m [Magnusiomyces paraingens]|uniref:KOW domain-containing protein n=1 Tax=Magnusiomyces paraingens TaxID=2606893 RepID=A0A5E8BEK8_9ASCO|nr:uncharacterized protein SAPINGB_P002568 [Saprochaete ingens]VVT50035.1 unnamed protein product [Saprochaete ingens]